MAGVVGSLSSPVFQPLNYRKTSGGGFRASAAPTRRTTTSEGEGGSSLSSSASSSSPLSFSPPPGFTPPQPKPFSVRYSASLISEREVTSNEYTLTIAGRKLRESSKLGPRPVKPIEIYEFESCPFCRKVREIVSILDLDVLFFPCPKNGSNFRPKVLQMGGKQQFPYMVDPNTGVSMYESDDIIKYLVNKYGDGTVPLMLSLGLLTTLTEGFAMIGRMGRGSSYRPSRLPPLPLELWAYEPSPFCKIVREVLVELELPHLLHSVARGSPKRQQLLDKVGHFQVPYLEDPNTGVKMFESADIVDYLTATYALAK